MKKIIFWSYFLLAITLISCSKDPNRIPEIQETICKENDCMGSPKPEMFIKKEDSVNKSSLVPDDFKSIEVKSTSGFRSDELAKFNESIELANEVIQTQCFKDFLLNRDMIQTNGQSIAEVVQRLTTNTVQVNFVRYFSRRSTVGYTYPNSDTIWTNRKFHSRYNNCQSGSNSSHETIGHKLGYGHDSRPTKRRPFSVPYSINEAFKWCCHCIDNICKAISELPDEKPVPDKKLVCWRPWYFLGLRQVCRYQ